MFIHRYKNLLNNFQLHSEVICSICTKATENTSTYWSTPNPFKTYGQPTHQTHPHLLKQGEVTPLITLYEFQQRREALLNTIHYNTLKTHQDISNHLIVIPSASKQYMSDKIPYVFRQNTDFLYLSGCLEPDSCLVLSSSGSPNKQNVILFIREKDSHSELWDGPRTGIEDAINLFGVDQALPVKELSNYLHSYLKSNSKCILWYDYLTPIQKTVHEVMQNLLKNRIDNMWEAPNYFIHLLRVIKSPAEIVLMQKTCDVASQAIIETIRSSKPGINEHQLFAKVEYECKMHGADFLAYPPVVAGGNRANVIHYINNNQIVSDGEMVLMDAGCEYHGYTSDITRTWPINGRFSPQQRELYEALSIVQSELIKQCSNMPSLDVLFDSMCRLLGKELQQLGLISKSTSDNNLLKAVYQFCPHHVSHYLGMDVHDTPSVPRNIKMQPGMIITVEPGIYINYKHKVPSEYQGLGVRIEDDVLITENGPVVLTRNCPRAIEEIEKFAGENQGT